jgi:hypothetical protein
MYYIQIHGVLSVQKKNVSENRTRLIFEAFFCKPFPKQRPKWNVNPWTNRLLELDGFCQEFNILPDLE